MFSKNSTGPYHPLAVIAVSHNIKQQVEEAVRGQLALEGDTAKRIVKEGHMSPIPRRNKEWTGEEETHLSGDNHRSRIQYAKCYWHWLSNVHDGVEQHGTTMPPDQL